MTSLSVGLFVTLFTSLAFAQTNGFLSVEMKPHIQYYEKEYTAQRCLQWSGAERKKENCLSFAPEVTLKTDQVEPLAPGIYEIKTQPSGKERMIEVRAGELTRSTIIAVTEQDLHNKIPQFVYYKNSKRGYHFSIARDFNDPSNYVLLEKQSRQQIQKFLNNKDWEYGLKGCTPQSQLELIQEKKVRLCKDGQSVEVPVDTDEKTLELLRVYQGPTNPEIRINKYGRGGRFEAPLLRLWFVDENSQVTFDISKVNRLVVTTVYVEQRHEYEFFGLYTALFPGSYVVVVGQGGNLEPVDVLPFKVK